MYPLLLAASAMVDLTERGSALRSLAVGYYSVLFALTAPLLWGFGVVAAGHLRWPALVSGALFTAACLSGFLQGFVLSWPCRWRWGRRSAVSRWSARSWRSAYGCSCCIWS